MGQQDHEFLWLPPSAWLLCLQYVCVLLNHMSSHSLDGLAPLQALTTQTPDISFLLHFSFYEAIYYSVNPNEASSNFPSTSNEKKGYWVGFSNNVGDKLTCKILTEHMLSGVPITPPLIFVMSCLQGRAILLTPTLLPMKIHLTSLNRISCGVGQSVKTTHHSTLITYLWQLSLWMI